jgi:hypothetical protein
MTEDGSDVRFRGQKRTCISPCGMSANWDPNHYDVIGKIETRPGSGTSLFVPEFNRLYVASQAIGNLEAAILVFEPMPP